MTLDSILRRARTAAATRMVDVVTISRVSEGMFDEGTGTYADGISEELYAGPAEIWQPVVEVDVDGGGGRDVTTLRRELRVPVAGTGGLRLDDIVTVTAARNDPDLVGRVLRVSSLHHHTHAKTRRFGVEEVTS